MLVTKKVRNSILPMEVLLKQALTKRFTSSLDIGTCFQFLYLFPLVIEIMLERNLFVLASQIFIDSHRQIRLPRHIADTEI